MKIITWNMSHWSRKNTHDNAWRYLLDLAPEIALVQESHPPSEKISGGSLIWHPIVEKKGDWGSGIYSKYPIREIEFENSYPGALIGAEVSLPDNVKITVFSLYGQLEKKYRDNEGFATTSVHKMLSDLTWLFLGKGRFKGLNRNLAIGGDFNISTQCDMSRQKQNKRTYLNAHKILFERISDFGLHSVFDWSQNDGPQTLRHKTSKIPWQNDYLFLSKNLYGKIGRKQVQDNEQVRGLSDHNPLIVHFNE